ncbi:hypothetical protein [Clostridium cylindrosporum]|uniref:Uncharacterized protein n=1 Tax=Clostridium cylindrosporum DSM 605 TaxID=1121307 RepID=A0A0J8G5R5_CLOCY|nr:hypothetical protein [Clostridium cylindrosporum]KMT22981.1 hypothetical protein CLCY_7c00280 [Clostridium cylindrosporum DSM 605]
MREDFRSSKYVECHRKDTPIKTTEKNSIISSEKKPCFVYKKIKDINGNTYEQLSII